ncbi:NlpC/P60 family protein [Chitinibacter sp. S2-10]|uniref:C40 family peptidase n=1 Tax=Chitinibacter sp. S2-10 TaxID=3373597 RepID=UPI0039778315
MKWIIILATVLNCAIPLARADQEMPLGDSAPATGNFSWNKPAQDNDTATESGSRVRKNKSALDAMPKGSDYQPAQDLLLSAMSLIGVKYTWGGNTPESGLDCSGFIKYVFQNSMNITLPRTAFEMAHTGQNIDKSELKPGDLVFFNTLGRTFSHVGIYLGDNRFIHAPRKGRNIEVANMNLSYWQNRFNGARRIADSGGTGLNVNSLLASSSRRDNTVTAMRVSNSSGQAQQKCKTVSKKKKKSVTQCKRVASSEKNKSSASSRKQADKKAKRGKTSKAGKASKKSGTKSANKKAGKKKS